MTVRTLRTLKTLRAISLIGQIGQISLIGLIGHRTPEAGHREGPEGPEGQRLDAGGWTPKAGHREGPDAGRDRRGRRGRRAGGWTPENQRSRRARGTGRRESRGLDKPEVPDAGGPESRRLDAGGTELWSPDTQRLQDCCIERDDLFLGDFSWVARCAYILDSLRCQSRDILCSDIEF